MIITGKPLPPFTTLLHLYSRLKPGKTVYLWMEENDVAKLGIDPRRFVSFGVIKGFLRRVHRWPYLLSSPLPSTKALKGHKVPTTPGAADGGEVKSSLTSAATGQPPTTHPISESTSNPTTPTPTPTPTPRAPLRRSSTFTPRTPLEPKFPTVKKEVKQQKLSKGLEGLPALLDGSKHTDELCVTFGVGWPALEEALTIIGGGSETTGGERQDELLAGDDPAADKMGLVRILYR